MIGSLPLKKSQASPYKNTENRRDWWSLRFLISCSRKDKSFLVAPEVVKVFMLPGFENSAVITELKCIQREWKWSLLARDYIPRTGMKRGGCWDCNHCGGSSQKRTVTGSREAKYGTDRNECNRECKNLSSWVGRLCGKRGKTFWRTLNGPCQGRGERWNRVTETICVCVSVCYFNFLGGCINLCQPWF